MTPERYEQIGQICDAALELAPGERAALIDRACGADEELRREVESLLEAHAEAGDFIATPALGMAAGLLEDCETPSLPPGRAVGHYRVMSLLGAGGMGEVYLAEDTRLGRKVALKLLPKEFTHDSERVRRFEREARAASALNHPNILTIHEIGRADGAYFIATELIEGETLRVHMAEKRMPLVEAIDVAAQISGALEVAHAAGVVHRDIKPENVMVRPDGYVKVLDFGLIKMTEKAEPAARRGAVGSGAWSEMTDDTEPGLVLGTVRYMTPEQTRGSAQVDHRTDIWSLGVVLYEMVTARAPFEGEDIHRRIIAIQESEPLPLAAYAEGVPERLEEIVRKALAKDPDERYRTARDLLIDLRNLKRKIEVEQETSRSSFPVWSVANEAVKENGGQAASAAGRLTSAGAAEQAPASSSAEVIFGEMRRHRRGFVIALAAFVLLTAGGAYGVYRWRRLNRPSDKASAPVPKVIPFTSFPGTEIEPSFSPDGRQIAFTWDGPGGDNFDVYVKLLDTGAPLKLTSHAGEDRSPCWSPDGRHIAFDSTAEGQRDIYVVGVDGGKQRRVTSEPSADVRPSWSRDGRFVYFGSDRSGEWQVWKAPTEGGPASQVTKQGGREAFESFDGSFVYYTKENVPGLWRVPAGGGEEAKVLEQARQGSRAVWEQGVYFVNPDARPRPSIEFYSFATNRTTRAATTEKDLWGSGLSITATADGRWVLYVQTDQTGSDIMLVENFS